MTSRQVLAASMMALVALCASSQSLAQSPGVLYTWDASGLGANNVELWTTTGASAIIDNAVPGTLRVIETGGAGGEISIVDNANRIRESITAGSGGLDLTGLDYVEFDLGHTGSGTIQIQPYVQASTGFNFVPLVPFVNIPAGPVATYQFPLSGLTPAQAVYIRTIGFKAFAHGAVGDVVWSINEVRSGGTPLQQRDLITHGQPGPEGGLQGAYINFSSNSVQGSVAGQTQQGLSYNSDGPGSLQWTDIAGGDGAGINWGNGTPWDLDGPGPGAGNTFNNREFDLSNYDLVKIRLKATDPANGGGTIGFTHFYRRNNFSGQNAGVGNIPIDGKYHTVTFSLAGMTLMDRVDAVGFDLFNHPQTLIMNIDSIRYFAVPEPATGTMALVILGGVCGFMRRSRRS